jgi:succinate dehydrogenase membrane anchor subunit
MTMKTPLGKVRGLGSARSGTRHFWHQRLTAVANIPLTLFLIWLVARLFGSTHGEAVRLLSSQWVAIALLLALGSVLYHMRIGMQVVIEDYVHGEGAKVVCLMANTFFALAVGATAAFAIFKLGFGG